LRISNNSSQINVKKKVLIITYYWPPSGGSAVIRWVKFVKYLRQFNYEPVVYSPLNAQYPVIDDSFTRDIPEDVTILKKKIWEPYRLFKLFTGRGKTENLLTGFTSETRKNKFRDDISNWIRSNIFIPDARKFWIRPSVAFLSGYLSENHVEAVITTGPPHSMHLIGLGLKKRLNIKWIADFRDPWTSIDFYRTLLLTKYADRKHHKLEKEVLDQADQIIVVSQTMKQEFSGLTSQSIIVIPNGFDEENIKDISIETTHKFSLVYTGIMNPAREPKKLWQVLTELINENENFAEDFDLLFIGNIDYSIIENISTFSLDRYFRKIDFMAHDQVIQYQKKAQVLLLPLNDTPNARGIVTGKLFEYLAARRPIIAIGPVDGDAATIINETRSGSIFDFNDSINLKNHIKELYEKYRTGNLEVNSIQIEKFSRRNLTAELAKVLTNLSRQ
jgi:glycosyltransferase involved in cell wall biosynthesis